MNVPFSILFPDVAVEMDGCPQPVITHYAIKVLADFGIQTRYTTEVLDPIDVVANTAEYEVAPTESATQLVRIEQVWLNGEPLDPIAAEELDAEMPGWRTEVGLPKLYTSEDGVGTIRLVPSPAAGVAGGLLVKLSFAVDPTASPKGFSKVLYQRFSDGLAAGIKARLAAMPNKPWSRPELVEGYRREYHIAVSMAKNVASKGLTKARRRSSSYYR